PPSSFLIIPPPPISTLFPYTTLFRSLLREYLGRYDPDWVGRLRQQANGLVPLDARGRRRRRSGRGRQRAQSLSSGARPGVWGEPQERAIPCTAPSVDFAI